ncbi:radical SAM protein [Streptomyces hoynatensis]|uniref:radical SAM protein n=1 Tax=Streptomyces hoynatensis TaxID=1141874 RepID=UPI00131A0A76|nr:radical SAM protein [Streptomyces hoynatensis]
MRRLTHAEATRLRRTPGATVALFLTDRCPVGCAHCSVDSLPGGPTIRDWDLFTRLVDALAELPGLQAVAITGGEPFAERRGLTYAVRRLHAAGTAVLVFTSGFWARSAVPAWVRGVLELTGTVYLSTDAFHAAALDGGRAAAGVGPGGEAEGDTAARAARAVVAAGCHLVVQTLAGPEGAPPPLPHPAAEHSLVPPLPAGRGARLFPRRPPRRPLGAFAPCALLHAPTVRYDGLVTACCNETVLTGGGPAALRRRVSDAAGLREALRAFRADPVLRLMGAAGPVGLSTVVEGRYGSVCEPCWLAQRRAARDPEALASLRRLATLGTPAARP